MSDGRVRTRQSGVDDSIPIDIIEAAATFRDKDPTALPPLYQYIDPEALGSLFERTPDGRERSGTISFHYYGFAVTVSYGDETTIELVDES